jgi:uncharacterized protein (TIGR03437 family)
VLTFGGPVLTIGRALAIDESGNLYITGETSSSGFPLVKPIHSNPGPVSCMAIGGGGIPIDAVIMKLDPSGRVLFSTFISGNGHDFGKAIAVDVLGRIYVAGGTTSTDLPLPNALQSAYAGGPPQPVGTCEPGDAFLLQIDPVAGRLLFGTLLGGPGADSIENVFSAGGVVTVTGTTNSGPAFPGIAPVSSADGPAFVARIVPLPPTSLYSRLLDQPLGSVSMSPAGRLTGGAAGIVSLDIADPRLQFVAGFGAPMRQAVAAPDGFVLAIGSAGIGDPFNPINALRPTRAGFHDAWFAKVIPPPSGRAAVVNAASFAGPEIAPGSIATIFTPEPGAEARIQDQPAHVLAAAGNQISVVVPEGLSSGPVSITVTREGRTVAAGAAILSPVAPAIFTAAANGRGAPAAQLIRIANDGTRSEQQPFVCDPACRPAPVDAGDVTAQSVLVLYGTGIRHRASLDGVQAIVAGEELPVQFAGAQPSFAGLDQVNVSLPATLAGHGEVDLVLIADGRLSNPVRLHIR